jgi:release factor glutamine methyltransferase
LLEERRRRIRAALDEGCRLLGEAGLEDPLREADFLLARCLGVDRVRLHSDPPEPGDHALRDFESWIRRRADREPAAYITGEAEFWSRSFRVSADVLVPRPETEHLVTFALAFLEGRPRPVIVDVGTGSGCLAVTLALEVPRARVLATDRSREALVVALENARRHGVEERVDFVQGDLLEPVKGPVDLVLSNPPYVGDDEEVAPECLHEPRSAVFAGADALACYRTLASQVSDILRPDGAIAVETPGDRENEIAALFTEAGLRPRAPILDLAGRPRVVVADAIA